MTDELHPVQPCGSNADEWRRFGHRARKATWLFVAGVDLSRPSIAALICSAWVRAEEGRPTVAYIVNPEDPT